MAARIPPDDAVSAYILSLNGVLPENAVLDVRALSEIKMPNRKMFVGG
jgi:S-disulfanyl-L-cysteine oxidoreductase SoxD